MSLYSPSATELRVGQEDFREKKYVRLNIQKICL